MSGSGKRWSGWGCRKNRDYQKEAGCKSFTNCLSFSISISHQCFTEMYCIISNVCLWNVEELDGSLDTLKAAFEKATSEKLRCEDEVNCTNTTIQLANRLVKGLEVRLHWFRLLDNTYMFMLKFYPVCKLSFFWCFREKCIRTSVRKRTLGSLCGSVPWAGIHTVWRRSPHRSLHLLRWLLLKEIQTRVIP